jgi:predicted membrane protein
VFSFFFPFTRFSGRPLPTPLPSSSLINYFISLFKNIIIHIVFKIYNSPFIIRFLLLLLLNPLKNIYTLTPFFLFCFIPHFLLLVNKKRKKEKRKKMNFVCDEKTYSVTNDAQFKRNTVNREGHYCLFSSLQICETIEKMQLFISQFRLS